MKRHDRPVETAEERESLAVAEGAREKVWTHPSVLKELFLGRYRLDLVAAIDRPAPVRPEFQAFYDRLETFLREKVDPVALDATGEYPEEVVDGLRRLGAFGMKIPTEYGGLGFSQVEYSKIMELLGSYDGSVVALLSAHQSIGLPQPLKMFGTPERKKAFLPRCAAGAISAFALTEEGVGSDPARLSTTVTALPDGSGWILDGEKLWCTNGTIAELLVVMARHADSKKISAFVVESAWPGVRVEHRCHFMGLKALANGVISFRGVRVPRENLIGKEGQGLKIALMTLNTGRLSLPAGASGMAKVCVEVVRTWAKDRVQWGQPVGRHEAIAHKIADMAATTFAMEAVSNLASEMADRGGYDIRLEAAAAKEWNSVRGWKIIDDTMQVRGGRGYETEASLAARGERPMPVERAMRDYRINLIFEGSSEIMHLFMAREAVDRHLEIAGDMIARDKTTGQKLAALPKVLGFYAGWYPTLWLGWGHWPRFAEFGSLAPHVRFCERNTRRLARNIFHGMAVYGGKLQKKQAFLFRMVDVANELFAMTAAIFRAHRMRENGQAGAERAAVLADLFCRDSRRRVKRLFAEMWRNDDVQKYRVAQQVLRGEHAWLEEGVIGLDEHPASRAGAWGKPKEQESESKIPV